MNTYEKPGSESAMEKPTEVDTTEQVKKQFQEDAADKGVPDPGHD